MDVLEEIVNWSKDRPAWQRDALRRLVLKGNLDEADYSELAELCKGAHGLSERRDAEPLNKSHIPNSDKEAGVVNLLSITHHCGVNALAEEQTISFGPGLTVVYGDNASGKSGYTRILKDACRARGTEVILGNVLSGTAPPPPSFSINFTVGKDGKERTWSDIAEDREFLSRVSVFDSYSAAVYLKERTDVAFRPFGLDLFDKLSIACEEVKKRLDKEGRELEFLKIELPEFPEGTPVHKLVSNLSSLTKRQDVIDLGTLTEEEKERLTVLEKLLMDMQSENFEKTAHNLIFRSERLQTLTDHMENVDRLLDMEVLKKVFDAQKTALSRQAEAEKLREATFPPELLNGTGSDAWRELWDSAGRFSTEIAYTEKPFPYTEADARCLLCQQNLDSEAIARFIQFQKFVTSQSEQDFKKAKETFRKMYDELETLEVFSESIDNAVKELEIEDAELATDLRNNLKVAETRQTEALKASQGNRDLPSDPVGYTLQKDRVLALKKEMNERAQELLKKTDRKTREEISNELRDLKSRETLSQNKGIIFDEIDRKRKLAAYQLCLNDTTTNMITRKSTEVTKEVVTNRLKESFIEELKTFRFTHVEVELKEAGGERGALYHKLILTRAPGIDLPKIVSEGEARCLSIAAFFAELSTADDPSTILFDDPVSSLDHKWRSYVARRLVEEAKTRQVVVFTHDIVFLLALRTYAEQQKVDLHDQHLRRERLGAGVCDERLPWAAMKVKTRIGVLKNDWQSADKNYRDGNRDAYEREAILIYGLLRESWERAFEEILLNSMVERFRESIQTLQIRKLSDITDEDCELFEAGMTKCSKWLPGHDQAPAAKEDVPEPGELKADIEALEKWVDKINKRRR